LSQSLSARAFTTGRDVFFRQGEYSPGSSSGRELLAHELTHVVQQNGDGIQRKMTVSEPGDAHEIEADQMARQVVRQEIQHTPSADAKSAEVVDDDVGSLDEKRPRSPVSDAKPPGSISVHRASPADTAEHLKSAKYAGNPQLESAFHNAPVLRQGITGDGVRLVQEGLVADGFAMPISTKPDGQMDGDFGGETASAVTKFQSKHALSPDSRVGHDTMGKLDDLAGGTGPTPPGPGPVPPSPPPPVVPLTVTIGKVRAPSTPAAMAADRVPPRVDTAVNVTVSGVSLPMAPVTLSVDGAGGSNGTATLNGAATIDLTANAVVQVRGGTQTAPGNGGKLRLLARQGTGPQLAASNPFTVSSIPQNYSDTFVSLVTGPARGIVVQDGWESDSGIFTDLDETEISERVEHKSSSGSLAGFASGNSGYQAGNVLTTDTHSTSTSSLTGNGNVFTHQTCMFKDHRTGAADIPMTASGFHLTRNVVAPVPPAGGPITITTSKVGGAATANGISSGAGTANVVKTQNV
jgi:peptidoglycan hydrolase-like protein with peptidoglycan-binding domain